MNTKTLFRPVGLSELELIAESNWSAFPPRLEWQPIFYPVLNQAYAEQIAKEWNTEDAFSGFCGVVTCFDVWEEHLRQYEVQNVGASLHDELWIPADALEMFNENIIGGIKVLNAFFGKAFVLPEHAIIKNKLLPFYHEV